MKFCLQSERDLRSPNVSVSNKTCVLTSPRQDARTQLPLMLPWHPCLPSVNIQGKLFCRLPSWKKVSCCPAHLLWLPRTIACIKKKVVSSSLLARINSALLPIRQILTSLLKQQRKASRTPRIKHLQQQNVPAQTIVLLT